MSLSPAEKQRLYDAIAPHLEAIGALFKDPRITLVVRTPGLPKGDFIMTSFQPAHFQNHRQAARTAHASRSDPELARMKYRLLSTTALVAAGMLATFGMAVAQTAPTAASIQIVLGGYLYNFLEARIENIDAFLAAPRETEGGRS